MELELGLSLPSSDMMMEKRIKTNFCKKRSFDEVLDEKTVTLPLFLQREEDGHGNSDSELNYGGGRVIVGWPPVKLPRRRTNCVKVNMEGIAIGRKVDLSLHDSYQALFRTLYMMFPKKHEDLTYAHVRRTEEEDGGCDYKVTYEDEDGDWMLVGDVPWEAFIMSAKRLRIIN
ncbi:auxin-responsive protein IAA20-like [Zingiber officinale]|uniref:auxin-responsive protein IAA20-like n=1 Tax=Zingiber officinale TaxID=94328 RepID=UPI001C4DD39E|nr:auxin-responsive protein IAA20-like [Zingiber officinale]